MKGLHTGNSFDFFLPFHSSSVISFLALDIISSHLIAFGHFHVPKWSHFQTLRSLVHVYQNFILILNLKALSPFRSGLTVG